jgi:DNA-directed RNA polymerase subunit alpha
MHIIQEEIGLPKIKKVSETDFSTVFEMEPLPSGFGMTLGNSLRRVLLSSLPGASLVAVKVYGANHEYTTLPGLKDSILDLILNLKGVNFKKHSKGRETLVLEKKGEGVVKASDIKTNTEVEILNPDYEISYLTGKNSELKIDLIIEKNVGYSSAKSRLNSEDLSEFIQTDASFSPVKKVRYQVLPARVGENTNLDKLVLEVETNGSISPEDSVKFSANLINSYFTMFTKDEEEIEQEFLSDFSKNKEEEAEEERESYTPIEILNFSPRTLNALINGEIGSIEQLVKCNPSKLQSLRGFGKKAMDEVSDALGKRGLSLTKDD